MKTSKKIDRKEELKAKVEHLQESLRYCRKWMASHPKTGSRQCVLVEARFRNLKHMLATAKNELKEELRTR